jgi:rod shape-determining protein MreD
MAALDIGETARGAVRVVSIYFFLLLLFLLNLADIPLLGSGSVRPAFLLIGIYFWTITKPALLPVPVVFLIGLAFDIVSASVVGLHTFAFMLIVMLVRSQRRYLLGQTWPVLWVGFVVAALILSLIQMLVYVLDNKAAPPVFLMLAETLVSALAYPVLIPVMMGLNRFLTVAKQDYS